MMIIIDDAFVSGSKLYILTSLYRVVYLLCGEQQQSRHCLFDIFLMLPAILIFERTFVVFCVCHRPLTSAEVFLIRSQYSALR